MSLQAFLKMLLGVAIPLASFLTGLRAAHTDPLWLAKRPALLLRSLLVILVVVPVGAVLLLQLIGASDLTKAGLTIAIFAIGIGPPAAFSKAKQHAEHEEAVAYEVGLDVALLALAIVYIPAALALHGAIFHHSVNLGVGQVAGVVLTRALIPLFGGLVVGRLLPRVVAPLSRYAGIFVQIVILAIVVVAVAATWRQLIDLGARTWLTCAAIVLGEIAVGHLAASGELPEIRRMLVAFSSMRFPALALLLVSVAPRGRALVPVILAYVLTSVVLTALYGAVASRRARGERRRSRVPVSAT